MPNLINPSFYERAVHTAPGHSDRFIKWLDDFEYLSTTGDIECPLGWVGLIEITRDLIATWVASDGDPWMSERRNFDLGWYIVHVNSDGIVFAEFYGVPDDTLVEEAARADYAEAEDAYATWLDMVGQS